jgi:hypothetical protein
MSVWGAEPGREEARRHAALVAICGVLIGVILISLATAATALPVYVIILPDLTNNHLLKFLCLSITLLTCILFKVSCGSPKTRSSLGSDQFVIATAISISHCCTTSVGCFFFIS